MRFCKFKLALTGIQVCIEIIKFAFFRTQVCVCENLSLHQKNQVVVNRSELLRTRYFSSHFIAILFTYQCKPHGGVSAARGADLTARSISSVGGLIEYPCSGVGTFDLFVLLPVMGVVYMYRSNIMFSYYEKSSCLLKSGLLSSAFFIRISDL